MQIKLLQSAHLCWRDTTLMRTWEWHGVLATHEAPPAAAVIIIVGLNREDVNGQSTDQTMQSCVMLLCVCWTAQSRTGTLLPTGRLSAPFRRRPVTVLVIIIGMWIQCELLLSSARAKRALVHDIVRSLGAAIIGRSPISRSISRYRLIDMKPTDIHHPHSQ